MKKGQSALEFMVFIGMATLILLVGLVITSNYMTIAFEQQEISTAEELVKILQNEVNLAARVQDGYRRTFILPPLLDKRLYKIQLYEREVAVLFLDNLELDFAKQFATEITIGSASELEINSLNPESVEITKNNEIVTFTFVEPV